MKIRRENFISVLMAFYCFVISLPTQKSTQGYFFKSISPLNLKKYVDIYFNLVEPQLQDYHLWNFMKDCVWLKRPKNEKDLRQEINNFHLKLQEGGEEFEQVQKAIDGFPKRLISVIEFQGKNYDHQKKNFAWAKHLENFACATPVNTTTEELDAEMVELLLVEDASFNPTLTSTPNKNIPSLLPETPTVSYDNRLKAKKNLSRKQLFK